MPDQQPLKLYEWESKLTSGGRGQIVTGRETIPTSNSPFTKGSVGNASFIDGSTSPAPRNQPLKLLNFDDLIRNRPINYTEADFDRSESYQQLKKGIPYTRSAGALPPAGWTSNPEGWATNPRRALPPAGQTSQGIRYTFYPDGGYSWQDGNTHHYVPDPHGKKRQGFNTSGYRPSDPDNGISYGQQPPPKKPSGSGSPSGNKTGGSGGQTYDRRGGNGGSSMGGGGTRNAANSVSPFTANAQKRSTNSPVDSRSRPLSSKAPVGSPVDIAPQRAPATPTASRSTPPPVATLPRPQPSRPGGQPLNLQPLPPTRSNPQPLNLQPRPQQRGNPVGSNSSGSGPVRQPGATPIPQVGWGRPTGGAASGTGANRALSGMMQNAKRGMGPGLRAQGPMAALNIGLMTAQGVPPLKATGITAGSMAGGAIGGTVGRVLGGMTGPLAPVASQTLGVIGQFAGSYLGGFFAGQFFPDQQQPPPQPLPYATGQYLPPPPFTGGQSIGVSYLVSWTTQRYGPGGPYPSGQNSGRFSGPIRRAEVGNSQGFFYSWGNSNGYPPNGQYYYAISSRPTETEGINILSFSAQRADGQPDTGGSPPVEPEPAPAPNFSPINQSGLGNGGFPLSTPLAAGAGAAAAQMMGAASNPTWQQPTPAANPFPQVQASSAPGRGPEQLPFAEPTRPAVPAPFFLPTPFSPGIGPGTSQGGTAPQESGVGSDSPSTQPKTTGPQTVTRRATTPSSVTSSNPSTGPQIPPSSWAPPKVIQLPGTFTPWPTEETTDTKPTPQRAPDGQPRPTNQPPLPQVTSPSTRDPFNNTVPFSPTVTSTTTPTVPQTTPSTNPATNPNANPSTNPDPNANPSTNPSTSSAEDFCQSSCMQSLGSGMDGANGKLDQLCALVQKIANTVGINDFPSNLPLLTGDRNEVIGNLPQLVLYVVKNLDAINGKWPLEASMIGADGKEARLKLEDQSHALSEMFAALKVVAEDADASVNAAVRLAAELVSTKVSVLQGNELLRANKKFLGYQSSRRSRQVKLQFSPKIGGLDNKVDNYEMKQFFTPSTQTYLGYECVDKRDLMGIALRTLEDGEIARAAMFKPLVKDKKGKSALTGDHIRKTREDEKKKQDEEWKDFQGLLKKQGAKYRVTKGVKKRKKNGFDTGTSNT